MSNSVQALVTYLSKPRGIPVLWLAAAPALSISCSWHLFHSHGTCASKFCSLSCSLIGI
uniref:Uncharacterized protein n=1 Tax=Utricularia reniformis TaxID=192314 RepID=A0A1Y0AZM5_9LAMI|nr:hypothetical protein AEK19_MT0321 [Utricularia reniformis]ART30594.1 hypothetical protein AEK19_MT0321 [Utricularia reniformis]